MATACAPPAAAGLTVTVTVTVTFKLSESPWGRRPRSFTGPASERWTQTRTRSYKLDHRQSPGQCQSLASLRRTRIRSLTLIVQPECLALGARGARRWPGCAAAEDAIQVLKRTSCGAAAPGVPNMAESAVHQHQVAAAGHRAGGTQCLAPVDDARAVRVGRLLHCLGAADVPLVCS